jgi:hypothetical protein
MFSYADGRKGLVALIAVLCLLPVRVPTAASSSTVAWQGAGCGQSMQGADRLSADLGLDNALASRVSSLVESATGSGQPPPANQIQSLTDDSIDGLTDAGDQLDQAADEIGRQLGSKDLPRQSRAWSRGVGDMRTARTSLRSALRQDPIAPQQRIGSLSATGVGPRVLYEAAAGYQSSVENLGSIADQSGFREIGQKNWIAQGQADTMPPQNPLPDPWQEWLRRLQAQQARIRNNVNGLNAARALQAGRFPQAQQNAADMQKAVQAAQNLADQLGQILAPCSQSNQNQQQARSTQSSQPQGQGVPTVRGTGVAAPGVAASSGGGGAGALKGGLAIAGAAGAATAGYVIYKGMSVCADPQVSFTACGNGSCSACVAAFEALVPYCDCLEEKHPDDATGLAAACRQSLSDMRQVQSYYSCLAPTPSTPSPASASVR